jgi:plasmid stability protein
MGTTIRIDDELYRTLKARAASEGRPVAAIIEDAVRAGLAVTDGPREGPLPELPTYGGSGTLPDVDLADSSGLRAVMDDCQSARALR